MIVSKVWYQEFWVWVLIAIPFSAVAFGIVMLTMAGIHHDDLVIDDYYKEGKAINSRFSMDTLARTMKITAVLDATLNEVQIANVTDSAVSVALFHVTSRELDREYLYVAAEGDRYQAADKNDLQLHFSKPGVWYLEIKGIDSPWRLRRRVETPVSEVRIR